MQAPASGPVLVVPYVETVAVEEKNDKGEVIRTVKARCERRLTYFLLPRGARAIDPGHAQARCTSSL
jgi:hypothetical protein